MHAAYCTVAVSVLNASLQNAIYSLKQNIEIRENGEENGFHFFAKSNHRSGKNQQRRTIIETAGV